jgi:hypothetical protein
MTSVWGNIFLVILLTAVIMKSTGLVLDNDENDETFYKRSTCKYSCLHDQFVKTS